MNHSRNTELRALIGRLSDDSLASDEIRRLNELLMADPIAQQEYLDHFLLDGLLEREYAGAPAPAGISMRGRIEQTGSATVSSISLSRSSSLSKRVVLWISAAASIAAVCFYVMPSDKAESRQLTLSNSGFESGALEATGTTPFTTWYGDVADVVEQFSGVTPSEGHRMLRFVKSSVEPENACELYQVIDLHSVAGVISRKPMAVEASALFNAIDEKRPDHDCAFGVTVFAFTADPWVQPHVWPMRWEHALTFSGAQARADNDSGSWQRVSTRLALPSDTKYLVIQLQAIRTDLGEPSEEFPGQFADNVKLSLVKM